MIEKDYIMRFLLHFLNKVSELLSKKNYDDIDILTVENIYQNVFHESRDFFLKEDISKILKNTEKDCHYERLKLLALTFQLEAKMSMDANKKEHFLEKSLSLLVYISQNDSVYDLESEYKIKKIKDAIGKK